jgi:hypothetical protein
MPSRGQKVGPHFSSRNALSVMMTRIRSPGDAPMSIRHRLRPGNGVGIPVAARYGQRMPGLTAAVVDGKAHGLSLKECRYAKSTFHKAAHCGQGALGAL